MQKRFVFKPGMKEGVTDDESGESMEPMEEVPLKCLEMRSFIMPYATAINNCMPFDCNNDCNYGTEDGLRGPITKCFFSICSSLRET